MAKKQTLAQRIAADPKLKAKYLKDPGLRSKLTGGLERYLTPQQRKQRADNAYQSAPITEGSTVTNRDLGREANSATLVQYGLAGRELQNQQAREQAVGRDTAGWYDAYRRELQQHTANTALINQAAVGQIGQLGAGMRGLDQTALTAQQTAANTDAATRGASAANLGPEASNASLVRQQMLANFGVQQVGLGAAASRYADTNANVVAPTQKLQARAQSAQNVRDVGKKITDLKMEAGAFNQNYRDRRKADESKNVIAMSALKNDISNTAADNQQAAANAAETRRSHNLSASQSADRLAESTRSHRANETAAQERIRIAREKAAAGTVRKPATREAHAKIKSEIDEATVWIKRLRAKNPSGKIREVLATGRAAETKETEKDGKKSKKHVAAIPKLSKDAINAAYDLVENGELSKANIDALHRAGISVRQLGYPTKGTRKKAKKTVVHPDAAGGYATKKSMRP